MTTSPCKAWITSSKSGESGMIPRNCYNLLHIYIPPALHVFVFFSVRILHDFRHKLLTNCSYLGNKPLIISGYTLYCKQLLLIRLFFIILGQWDISHWLLPFQDHFTIWSKGYLYFTTTFSDFVVRFFLPFPSSRCLSQRHKCIPHHEHY